MKILRKKENGITLIALIITIIILLILAGVTIYQLTENGLFQKSKLAKEKSEEKQNLENSILTEYENEIEKYATDGYNEKDYSKYGKILNILYKNAGKTEQELPTTIDELVNEEKVFEWVLQSQKNVDYIIQNPDIFKTSIVQSSVGMKVLGSNKYAGYKAIDSKTWRNNILDSTYLNEFNLGADTVPVMTSNNSPEGEAFVSNSFVSEPPYYCFDNDDTTCGTINRPYTLNGYIGYKFSKKIVPYYVSILNFPGYSNYFSNIKIQGSNDNNNWIDLTDVTSISTSGWSYIKLKNENSYEEYQYLRVLQTTDKGSAYYASAYTIQFYCREPI